MLRLLRSTCARAILLLSLAPSGLQAQGGSIAGRVMDGRSGLPVAAAEVSVAEGVTVTLTLHDGSYVLSGVPTGPTIVRVRRVGYREVSREATAGVEGNTFILDVPLHRETLSLDEGIRHAAPDGATRRQLGYTVAALHAADVAQDVAITSWQDLLTGRIPGLRFTRLSGNLGTGSPFTLRSVSSFALSRTQPLVYVDGIRVNGDPNTGPSIGSGRNVSALDDLATDDVESVEVLRGPAAASLYGTEAAAGVIHILTKRGAEGPPRFSVSVRRGVNYMPDPAGRLGTMWTCPYDDRPGGGFINGIWTGYPVGPNPVPTGTDNLLCNEPSELVSYNIYEEANEYIGERYFAWPTSSLYQYGAVRGVDLEVSGGSGVVSYFLSTSYDDSQGFVQFNTNEALRMRANVGVTLRERLTLDVSTGYAGGSTRLASPVPGDGGEWQDMVWSNGYFLNDVTLFGSSGSNPRLGGFQEKLPGEVPENESTRDHDRFTGSATVRYQTPEFRLGTVTGSVTQRVVAGVDKGWDVNRNVFPLEDGAIPRNLQAYFTQLGISQWSPAYSENSQGTAAYERPITTNVTVDYALTVRLLLASAWSSATSFGAQYHEQEIDFFQNSGVGFTSPLSRTINQIQQANVVTGYSRVGSKSVGAYASQQVGFRNRAFFSASLRVDDNSTFGDLVGGQTYPSVSGSWVVSEEGFWPQAAIGTFRLRGAWGKAGRQPSPLANESLFTPSTSLGGLLVIRPATLGNPGIEPEVTSELELGFDASAFGDRVAASFTHFWRTTEGAIVDVEFPPTTGFPGTWSENLGRIGGWGWEAEFSAELFENGWMAADIRIAADHVNNEIEDLNGYVAPPAYGLGLPFPNQLTDDLVVDAWWDPAGPIQNDFGVGVSATCDAGRSLSPDPQAASAGRYGRVPGGAVIPCPSIPNPWIFMGPAFATHTVSVAPRLRFLDDRLHVFALAEGQYGRWSDATDKEWSHVYSNSLISRLQNDPEWVYGWVIGDDTRRNLFDASFWRMREIGARYELPQEWMDRARVTRATISLSARNPWILWQAQKRLQGAVITDPELGTPTLDGNRSFYETPSSASVNVTLRVTF